jgi:hypothetical protein
MFTILAEGMKKNDDELSTSPTGGKTEGAIPTATKPIRQKSECF